MKKIYLGAAIIACIIGLIFCVIYIAPFTLIAPSAACIGTCPVETTPPSPPIDTKAMARTFIVILTSIQTVLWALWGYCVAMSRKH